jgi:FlaA1/EpsC-like NDP-sugar epimerase
MLRRLSDLASSVLSWPRPIKSGIVLVLDIALCVVSVFLAYYLRLGEWIPLSVSSFFVVSVSISLAIPLFVTSGLYRAIFRYSGAPGLVAIARAMVLYGAVFSAIYTFWGVDNVPRTIGLIQPMLLLLLVVMSRAAARAWLGGLYSRRLRRAALRGVLVYGAGSAGRQLASAMQNSPEMRVVGFLDDDDRLHGHVLNGLPIHNPSDLAEILQVSSVTDVLLALPSVPQQRRNEILDVLKPHKVLVRTLPGLSDIATGRVKLSDIRELDADDLLGREAVKPNGLLLNLNTRGKCVLVTGAGGSIGSELCRQILKMQPKRLLLVDVSEYALYQIHRELQALQPDEVAASSDLSTAFFDDLGSASDASSTSKIQIEIVPLLASVCDEVRINEIMRTWRPETVYHAAAYKHVPLVEHNPIEGVRNNVWGTRICAEVALRNGVRSFVLVSTDKAVRPTNIMGATKRLAEMILQAYAEATPLTSGVQGASRVRTVFSIVRFGNVLGSSGSVVPLFREQIRAGGPITLTHSEITRYFMTIPEAAQLVIQAGAMAHNGDVFVLDMGQPVRIIDLARRMVELSGLTVRDELNPDGDIEFVVTGLRPGEKLFEELLIGDNSQPTQHSRILKAREQFLSWSILENRLRELSVAMNGSDTVRLRGLLQDIVDDYRPSGAVVDWVHTANTRWTNLRA